MILNEGFHKSYAFEFSTFIELFVGPDLTRNMNMKIFHKISVVINWIFLVSPYSPQMDKENFVGFVVIQRNFLYYVKLIIFCTTVIIFQVPRISRMFENFNSVETIIFLLSLLVVFSTANNIYCNFMKQKKIMKILEGFLECHSKICDNHQHLLRHRYFILEIFFFLYISFIIPMALNLRPLSIMAYQLLYSYYNTKMIFEKVHLFQMFRIIFDCLRRKIEIENCTLNDIYSILLVFVTVLGLCRKLIRLCSLFYLLCFINLVGWILNNMYLAMFVIRLEEIHTTKELIWWSYYLTWNVFNVLIISVKTYVCASVVRGMEKFKKTTLNKLLRLHNESCVEDKKLVS